MIVKKPLEAANGIISCPSCSTKSLVYLKHERTNIDYIEIPSLKEEPIETKTNTSLDVVIPIVIFLLVIFIYYWLFCVKNFSTKERMRNGK